MNLIFIVPVIISFVISITLGPVIISFLKQFKIMQTERKEGVPSHQMKAGLPTMGGLIFLISTTETSLFFVKFYPKIIPILLLMLGFGIIGFIDDYLKVVLKRSDGLLVWQKLLCQFVLSGIFSFFMINFTKEKLKILLPFSEGKILDIGWLAIPLLFIMMLSVVNGVNFTDGLDGLVSSVTIMVAIFFTVVAVREDSEISFITGAVIGSLIGFLIFNIFPAKVFMGDTGSLALGGFVIGTAYMMNMPLFLPIVGFIYVVELLSVVIQVIYFKLTHGKRLFKMSPLHHHFELCGWSEIRIMILFLSITALLCLVVLLSL
ncbi:MAG: phospho-N-acetylmuramoyl-pentapeptide-transferase [Lachnospiraceae bacterium]|nr:phospho-N-acetylmuramoyl-pentapeptide-transferase [Lachnospiraceae bacterium]